MGFWNQNGIDIWTESESCVPLWGYRSQTSQNRELPEITKITHWGHTGIYITLCSLRGFGATLYVAGSSSFYVGNSLPWILFCKQGLQKGYSCCYLFVCLLLFFYLYPHIRGEEIYRSSPSSLTPFDTPVVRAVIKNITCLSSPHLSIYTGSKLLHCSAWKATLPVRHWTAWTVAICRSVRSCLFSVIFSEPERQKNPEIKSVGKFLSSNLKKEILYFNNSSSIFCLFYIKKSLGKMLKYF